MSVTNDQVRDKLNASVSAVSEDEITAAIDVAAVLVTNYIGDALVDPLIIDRATLLVAVEQINQDNAPNGVLNQTYDVGVGDIASTPVRIGRDPMKPAYPVLAPWVSGKFFCA